MKLSQAGLDLLKESEGFRADAYQDAGGVWSVAFAASRDFMDQRVRNAKFASKPCHFVPMQKPAAHFCDVRFLKLMVGVLVASKVHETHTPLMSRIIGQGTPFKILGQVVGLYAINMIDGCAGEFSGNESASDKPVHQMTATLSVALLRYLKIARFRETWGKQLFRLHLLADCAARTDSHSQSRRDLYPATVRYKKLGFAIFNGAPLLGVLNHKWTIAQEAH